MKAVEGRELDLILQLLLLLRCPRGVLNRAQKRLELLRALSFHCLKLQQGRWILLLWQ